MKITKIVLVAVLLPLGATGCATVSEPFSPPLSQSLTDEKALYAAEAAFFGVQTLVNSSVDSGLLVSGSEKALSIADKLVFGKKILDQARISQRAGNTQKASELSLTALSVFAEVQALLQ